MFGRTAQLAKQSGRATAGAEGTASLQMRLKTPANSVPAAAFAFARWTSAGVDCAVTPTAPRANANRTADAMPFIINLLMCSNFFLLADGT